MPEVQSQVFYERIQKGQFDLAYLLFGEEDFLRTQALKNLLSLSLQEHEVDFNFNQFDSSSCKMVDVIDALETFPMMAERRVIHLKNIEELKEKELTLLEGYLKAPSSTSLLILSGAEIDKRKKFFKTVSDKYTCLEFKKPYDNQIPQWISHLSQVHGLSLSREAVKEFHLRVGNRLVDIDAQLVSLKIYKNGESAVGVEDVSQVIAQVKEDSVFEFIKSIGLRQRVMAMAQLHNLFEQGQSGAGIVALLARHFRILYQLHLGVSQGLKGPQLAHLAQVAPYFLDNYLVQTRHWSIDQVEEMFIQLNKVELSLKSSQGVLEVMAFEALILGQV